VKWTKCHSLEGKLNQIIYSLEGYSDIGYS